MYKNMLGEKFFKDKVFEDICAQKLVYSSIDMPHLEELARDIVLKTTTRAVDEANTLKKEIDPNVILKFLRGDCDNLNYGILHQKVLENEDELLPKMINMLINSGNSVFVEHVAKIIPQCKKNYSKELLEILSNIRSPYAISLICITLGFIASEDAIPILYDKYFELKKIYSNENYSQGPLLALYKLDERFYMKKN